MLMKGSGRSGTRSFCFTPRFVWRTTSRRGGIDLFALQVPLICGLLVGSRDNAMLFADYHCGDFIFCERVISEDSPVAVLNKYERCAVVYLFLSLTYFTRYSLV